jgi:Uma2 family endonuclease
MILLRESLKDHWKDRDDVFVGTNMFVYFSELQAKNQDFRGPDVFVVMDTFRRARKSWVVWEKDGRTPDVVIELLSQTTEKVDRGDKMRIYAKLLHVPEYYLFDPFVGVLEGYGLDVATRSYRRRDADPDGRLRSAVTGLSLGVVQGESGGMEAAWLRWFDGDGSVLPTATERARAEATRAEREAARAEREAARADEAQRRVAELEKLLGRG